MSSELLRFKARISAQERLTALLYARVEELSQDMTASFKQHAEYQIAFEQKVDTRFDRIEATMATKDDIVTLTTQMAVMEARMDSMDERMATKDDLAALEERMDGRMDSMQERMDGHMNSMEERMNGRMDSMEERMDTMATKQDVTAMEGRILDAFQQLVVMVDKRLSEAKR